MWKLITTLVALAFVGLFIITNSGGPISTPDQARNHGGSESVTPSTAVVAPAAPLTPSAPAASVADTGATATAPAEPAVAPAIKMTTRRTTVLGAAASSP